MKTNFLTAILLLLIVSLGYTQENKEIFKNNPPNTPPAIFMSSMPPCIIGVANQYGAQIGISKSTIKKTEAYIKEAMQRVPEFKKQVTVIEMQLLEASKKEDYKKYEELLHKLGDLKIKASLFHEELVKRARKDFDKEDIKKLDTFISTHKEEFLKAVKL